MELNKGLNTISGDIFEQIFINKMLGQNKNDLRHINSLQEHHFTSIENKTIFNIILDLFLNNKDVNMINVMSKVNDDKLRRYLNDLFGKLYFEYSIEDIVNKLIILHKKRIICQEAHCLYEKSISDDENINDYVGRIMTNLLNNLQSDNTSKGAKMLKHSAEEFKAYIRQTNDDELIKTDYHDLDNMISGFQKGDLIIIAGRPSMGKSSLLFNMALNIAKKDYKILIFSLETSFQSNILRLLSMHTKIETSRIFSKNLFAEDIKKIDDAIDELSNLHMAIDERSCLNMIDIKLSALKTKAMYGLDMIMIDYLQLITPDNNNNRNVEIGKIIAFLKGLAKEFNIPIVVASQLSRATEQRESGMPVLSDLRDSGTIEQDADKVMFIFRKEYYLSRNEPDQENVGLYKKWLKEMTENKNKATIMISKNRNGPVGNVELFFDPEIVSFKNLY